MMTPIVYIHFGQSFYQKYSFCQLHHTNPGAEIYLASDNDGVRLPFVKTLDISRYNHTAQQFDKIYQHLSSNLYDYELFCFRRWFILNEMVKQHGFKKLLYLDSDVMLFEDVVPFLDKYLPFDFTIANRSSPHICYFPDTKVLDEFCHFLLNEMYTSPFFVEKINSKHQYHVQNNVPGGVCDMTAFEYFTEFKGYKALELTEIRNGAVFDNNINSADGFEWDAKNKIKRIAFEHKKPFGFKAESGGRIAFKALHFQGGYAKRFMPLFYQYNDLARERKKDLGDIRDAESRTIPQRIKRKLRSYLRKIRGGQ